MKRFLALMLSIIAVFTACFSLTGCSKPLTGFDIELARKVVAYLNEEENVNIKIDFTEIDWNSKETLLEEGTIDLVWNGMTITPARSQQMTISVPYLYNKQVAVVRANDQTTYTSIQSMANATVGAESGSAGESVISAQGIGSEYISSPSQLDALTALYNGSIDVAIIDSVMAGYYTSTGTYKNKLVMVDNLVLATEEYGIAAKKGNESLISKINDALIALSTTYYVQIAEDFGLTSSTCLTANTQNPLANANDSSWADVVEDGVLVIGYTVFAPICYTK